METHFYARKVRDQGLLNNKILIPTANRYMRELGLFGRKAKRMNFHNKKHMARRRKFCNVVKNGILKSGDKCFLRTKSEWNENPVNNVTLGGLSKQEIQLGTVLNGNIMTGGY